MESLKDSLKRKWFALVPGMHVNFGKYGYTDHLIFWAHYVLFALVWIFSETDTKIGLNVQEIIRGHACERKWRNSWERLEESPDCNADLNPTERQREGRKFGWKHPSLKWSSKRV